MRKIGMWTSSFVVVLVLLASLFGGLTNVKANSAVNITKLVTSWPVDVTQTDPSWGAPIGMTIASGNPTWTSGFSVAGSSTSADFTMHFQRVIPGVSFPR